MYVCFAFLAQTATALELVTPLEDIKPTIAANFPIEEKIVLQAVDAFGRRVYSGPDSELVS